MWRTRTLIDRMLRQPVCPESRGKASVRPSPSGREARRDAVAGLRGPDSNAVAHKTANGWREQMAPT